MWGMTVSLADLADGYSEIEKGPITWGKLKFAQRAMRRGKVPGVYGVGQAEAAEDAFKQARRQQAKASLDARLKRAEVSEKVAAQMERFGDEGAAGVVRRRKLVAGGVAGGAAVAAGGGYGGYEAWDSRRKQPVKKGLLNRPAKMLRKQTKVEQPFTRKQRADKLVQMWAREAETVGYKRRPPVPGLPYNSNLGRLSEERAFAQRPRPSGPVAKSFDDEYVSKVSLKPMLSAGKAAAKKIGGGAKAGWQSGAPSQPFKEMNSPVGAGKAFGSQVGSAVKGGWNAMSTPQKYAGLAVAGTGVTAGAGGYAAGRVRKADEARRGFTSNTAIGGSLAAGGLMGVAMAPRDFRAARVSREGAKVLLNTEASERERAARRFRTPRGRRKIEGVADKLHSQALKHSKKARSKRAAGVAGVGLGALTVAQGGQLIYRDRKARRQATE